MATTMAMTMPGVMMPTTPMPDVAASAPGMTAVARRRTRDYDEIRTGPWAIYDNGTATSAYGKERHDSHAQTQNPLSHRFTSDRMKPKSYVQVTPFTILRAATMYAFFGEPPNRKNAKRIVPIGSFLAL